MTVPILKNRWLSLFILFILAAPLSVWAHHISMSFSTWELKSDQARVVFRMPLADAVWIMDPDLVLKQEVMIQIRVPVDETLRAKVRDYLSTTIPKKVTLTGCAFQPDMKVLFEGASVQVEAGLACAPGYLDQFSLVSHFLVDENRLHTSFATLNFPDRVQQCLFRSSQFTCGVKAAGPETKTAPAWQARIAPWWDYLALGLVLLILAGSNRSLAYALAALVLGHGLAPLALRLNLPIPASAMLRSVLAALTIYAGLLAWAAGREWTRRGFFLLLAGHALVLVLAWAEFLRLSPLMVTGLVLIAASVGATGRSPLLLG